MGTNEKARLIFRVHALRRMFQRRISSEDVHEVVTSGEVLRDYPDDRPYPSRLILKVVDGRPLHVVAACNETRNEEIIITAYEPDLSQWTPDFKRKLKP